MAIQRVRMSVYLLNNVEQIPFVYKDLPVGSYFDRDISAEQRKQTGTNQVYTEIRWSEGGTPQKAYVGETVASLLSGANS